MTQPLIIGIAGASGSGKSLFARSIVENIDLEQIILIQEDAYYYDLSDIPSDSRTGRNFDHPDAFDHELLYSHIQNLKIGKTIYQPVYDFKTHTRLKKTRKFKPAKVIIIEGILVLHDPNLVNQMNLRIFLDVDPDICFIRRLKRDISERGRNLDSVIKQYNDTVKPMYFQYISPSKRHAHIIIPQGGKNEIALDLIISKIHTFLSQ